MIPAGAHSFPAGRTKYQRYSQSAMLPFLKCLDLRAWLWFTSVSCLYMLQLYSDRWVPRSDCVTHRCIFPPPALLWKGRYNPAGACTTQSTQLPVQNIRDFIDIHSCLLPSFGWLESRASHVLDYMSLCQGCPWKGRCDLCWCTYVGTGKISAADHSRTCLSSGVWTGLNFRKGLKSGPSHLKLTHLSAAC